jgi:hypothetical protein
MVALVIASIALVGPFTYDVTAHKALDDATQRFSWWGGPLVGFDFTAMRQNVFSLARDLDRTVTVQDHGVTYRSRFMGFSNFISRGQFRTVADALTWFDIPLTQRQALEVEPCRSLTELHEGEAIIIQPDPFQRGLASWYGPGFHGRMAASGEIYNMYDRTAAHRTLPLQSLVRVVSQKTGASTLVRINDRGPYVAGRIIDMSYRAKELLGMGDLSAVYLERLDPSVLDMPCE